MRKVNVLCCILIFAFCSQAGANPDSAGPAAPAKGKEAMPKNEVAQELPWRKALNRIAVERDALSARLSRVHATLRELVRVEKPELLARLEKSAPKPAVTGYGLLPPLEADQPELTDSAPVEQSYSIPELGEWVTRENNLVARLDSRLAQRPALLENEVDFYNKRAENFRNLDAHIAYHRFWQDQVPKRVPFWDAKKQLLALYRSWRGGTEAGEQLEKEMLRFRTSPALCIKREPSGGLSLQVQIATDIGDEEFLAAFAQGVEQHWNGARAMREARLRIELTWDRRSPEILYPEGSPHQGERIDVVKHRERFGSAPFVLTTGADSTHVLQGAILLGTGRISRRILAHEFEHLLGFDDAYIRAYDAPADLKEGVVFREVTPFPGSLLASPGRGQVTKAMVDTLINACLDRGKECARSVPQPAR